MFNYSFISKKQVNRQTCILMLCFYSRFNFCNIDILNGSLGIHTATLTRYLATELE